MCKFGYARDASGEQHNDEALTDCRKIVVAILEPSPKHLNRNS